MGKPEKGQDVVASGKKLFKIPLLGMVIFTLLVSTVFSQQFKPKKPIPKDKCPVCGMFVTKYPDWIAQIIFKDGQCVFFDGAKDMFKYYFNLKKYNPSKKITDIAGIYVTDYYNLTFIEAYKAYYVVGSEVYGPMGRELIPFRTEEEAKEFLRDHKGRKILRFTEVTPELIKSLD